MPDTFGNPSPGDPGYVQPSAAPAATPSLTGGTTALPAGVVNTSATFQPASVDSGQTVSGGIQRILAEGSPLLQQARTRAAQKANASGLVNSSMAVQAGEAAAIDAALPIAAGDATQATQLATTNASLATNRALSDQAAATQRYATDTGAATSRYATDVGATTSLTQSNIAAETARRAQDVSADTAKFTANLSAQTQRDLQTVDNAFKTAYQTADLNSKAALQTAHDTVLKSIADTEANYKTLMQTSASASEIYRSTLGAISNIYADASIPAAAKANVINSYLGQMQQAMNLVGSVNGVDLTGLTDFGSVSAGAATAATNTATTNTATTNTATTNTATTAGAAANTALPTYLQDSRVSAEANALVSAMRAAGITRLDPTALEANPALAQAYYALNSKLNTIAPNNSFSILNDFRI